MRYIYFIGNGNWEDTHESNDKDELIKLCKHYWGYISSSLTDKEKKNYYSYVLETVNPDEDAEDHYDGNPVFDAKKWDADPDYVGKEN